MKSRTEITSNIREEFATCAKQLSTDKDRQYLLDLMLRVTNYIYKELGGEE